MIVLAGALILIGVVAMAGIVTLALAFGQWWLFFMLPIGFMPVGFGWGLWRTLRQPARAGRGQGGSSPDSDHDTGDSAAAFHGGTLSSADMDDRTRYSAPDSADHGSSSSSSSGSGSPSSDCGSSSSSD